MVIRLGVAVGREFPARLDPRHAVAHAAQDAGRSCQADTSRRARPMRGRGRAASAWASITDTDASTNRIRNAGCPSHSHNGCRLGCGSPTWCTAESISASAVGTPHTNIASPRRTVVSACRTRAALGSAAGPAEHHPPGDHAEQTGDGGGRVGRPWRGQLQLCTEIGAGIGYGEGVFGAVGGKLAIVGQFKGEDRVAPHGEERVVLRQAVEIAR